MVTAAGRRIDAQFIAGAHGDAPVLVFLHEGLGSIAMWKRFPHALVERTGCSALLYSRYGNGFSEPLNESRNVEYMHDEAHTALGQVLDAFEVHDAILFGHSDGASIALIYAADVRVRTRALITAAPHVFVEDRSIEGIARAKLAYETGDLRTRLKRYHQDVDRTFYGWNDIWLDPRFRAWNIRDRLRRIDVPMLLLQGAGDQYGTRAQIDAIHADAKGAVDSLYLAHCGHSPHRERPGIVASCVAAFVSSVRG